VLDSEALQQVYPFPPPHRHLDTEPGPDSPATESEGGPPR
jgi:hypothetical protein